MGFVGSINEKLRKFFWTHAKNIDGRKCYIGCSGNFTVEQILSRQCTKAEIFSNDVSLYSSAIGFAATGRKLNMEVVNSEITWVQKYLDQGGPESVVALLLLLELFKYEKRKNPFQERMWQTYLIQWEAMLNKTADKVRRALDAMRITDYTMIDVHDYYPRPDGISIGFLPTYVGGYEKLFARLEESIRWDKPHYETLTKDRREETIMKMTLGDYILYDDAERDLPCIARVDLFGRKTVFIYSNLGFKKGIFRKKINETVPHYPLLMPDEEIPDNTEVHIKITDLPTINHYRNMYLSKKIEPGSGGPCFLVLAGNKIFGFLIFQAYSQKGGIDMSQIYLLSDFVVPGRRYRRLSKLLLMVLKCVEMKQIIL